MGAHRPDRGAQEGGLTVGEDRPEDGAAAEAPRRNLYGRRHGKALRPSQRRLMVELLPRLRVPGVGPTKLDRYGEEIIAVVDGEV